MMIFVNAATKAGSLPRDSFSRFVRILAPFAPHLAEEIWERMGHTDGIALQPWPSWEEAKLAVDTITIAVQVNGKLRGQVVVPVDVTPTDVLAAARADEGVAKFLANKTLRREIYVPGRLVNLVVG
jgi:leucyl-tRNA synthetase